MSWKSEPIVVEQSYKASVDAVWSAITEIDQMVQWYFGSIPEFTPEVGFETRFEVENEGRKFLHSWKVTEVHPRKSLKYDWSYEGHPGSSFVVFDLFEEQDSTRLRLTHEVIESFPQHIPEFRRESGLAGWTYFITESLKDYLEKH
jgi:uncharacterized protein YndB with AHSA1/START domain